MSVRSETINYQLYKFNRGISVRDIDLNHNADILDAEIFKKVEGPISATSGYFLNGTTAQVAIADNANLDFDTNDDLFIEMEIMPLDVTRTTDHLINKEAGGIGYGLYINQDDLYLRMDDGTVDASGIIGTAVFENGVRAHILVSCDRAGLATAYVNGVPSGTIDVSGVVKTIANAGVLHIGNDSAGANEFYGEIYKCRIGNYTLTVGEGRALYYGLPLPYVHIGASQSEKMPNQVDRDFSGASAWANVDINAYDETGDLTITADAADQYCTLLVASAPTTVGKRYRMTFDVANLVGTWTIQDFTGAHDLGVVSADGTGQEIEWVATLTGGYRIVADSATSSADFDNFTLTQLGCTLELLPESVGHNQWYDTNGNELPGVVTAAVPINLPANHQEKYLDLAVTGDVNFTLPKGYMITAIVLTSDGAIGGGIDIGTTDGGGEVVTAEGISGAVTVLCALVAGANYNLTGADDIIYVTDADGTGWDSATVALRVQMQRVN